MFRKEDEQFLIDQIPSFLITLDNICNLEYFDELVDVRSKEEYSKDHILGSVNCPAITRSEQEVVDTLSRQDKVAARRTELMYIRAHLEKYVEDHFQGAGSLKKPPHTLIHTYRPLILSDDGEKISQLVGLSLVQLGYYPHIAEGGYRHYRELVRDMVNNKVEKFRLIVITGKRHSGKGQIINFIRDKGDQLLDLEKLSTAQSPSQDYFETLLCNCLLTFSVSKVVWVVYEAGQLGVIKLTQKMKEMMVISTRIHMETILEERIKFIIKDFQCVCRNENNIETAIGDVEKACDKNSENTWEDILSNNEGKEELIKDLRDVHDMLSYIAETGEENLEGHLFVIGRPGKDEDNLTPRFVED